MRAQRARAAGAYTVVGDAEGWIVLPPRALIQDWAWELLDANAIAEELAYEAP